MCTKDVFQTFSKIRICVWINLEARSYPVEYLIIGKRVLYINDL